MCCVNSLVANNRKSTNIQTNSEQNTYETNSNKVLQNHSLGHPIIEISSSSSSSSNSNSWLRLSVRFSEDSKLSIKSIEN